MRRFTYGKTIFRPRHTTGKSLIFSTADLLKEMDEAGIDAAVIHPPIWDPGADELALEAARLHPNRLSVLGQLPLDQPESRSKIAGWIYKLSLLHR